jgi:ferrous-iron efflux pump FieF
VQIEEHRFGHGKSESIAGLAQAMLIGASGIYVTTRALQRLLDPQPLSASRPALVVMLSSFALTLVLVLFQRSVLRRTDSAAIRADTLHYVSDLASNSAALLAWLLARWGWLRADPWLALAIALATLYGAGRIAIESFQALMDHELSADVRAEIQHIVLAHARVRGQHALRTRRAGTIRLIQLHIEVDPNASLIEADQVTHEVKSALNRAFPDADIIIHADPASRPCAQ